MQEPVTDNVNSIKRILSSTDNQFLFYHVHFCIELLLSTADDQQIEYIFQKDADQVKHELAKRLERGEKIVPAVECDNFCQRFGCKGHFDESMNY